MQRVLLEDEKIRYTIEFDERETIADELARLAAESGINVEQFIKRLIVDALESTGDGSGKSCELGENLEDFLVKNGALKR
ncbi:hypothetical protein [Methylophaga sp.]|uniref:hypothetical protein n=1 Tax=Methylophaga sp. TaxID=2024840 RepID=UPI003A8D19C6